MPTFSPAACVIGHPIAHSRSPLIHQFWLRECNIAGTYTAIDVEPDDLPLFIERLRSGELVGANVTIPHKQAVMPLCDEIDDKARRIGAVNTLAVTNGKIRGCNTDWIGFVRNLDDKAPGWDQRAKTALVLGAGGASRAIIVALIDRGMQRITVLNRTAKTAIALADEFKAPGKILIDGASLANYASFAPRTDLVVNTTSIGMHATRFEELDLGLLPHTCLVTDIVYVPLETPLLTDARALGLKTVDGLGMLLHQAVPGFAAWFGQTPKVSAELRAHIEASLGPS